MRSPSSQTVFNKEIDALWSGQNVSGSHNDPAVLASACFAREDGDVLGGAFPRKLAVHAGFGGTPIAEEFIGEHLEQALEVPRVGNTAAYVHVPFCESHCLYCGFFTKGYERKESARYADALQRELDMWNRTRLVRSGPVHCVYLGGGTPTALEAVDLGRVIRAVRDALPLANDCEITVEGRIHNFGPEKMEACLDAGANRFSIGVQTFDTALRRAMGRKAAREDILPTLRRLMAYGQAAVVIDLIYGFPRQDMDMWRRDLDTALDLELDGIDLYQLNTFAGTPLHQAIEKGDMPRPADIAVQARMYAEGCRTFEEARWRRLSSSHYGRTNRERNIYNHMVKGFAHCLAYGPGAGGVLHGNSYFLERGYARWANMVEQGVKPVSALMLAPPHAAMTKALAQAFDHGRINLPRLDHVFGLPLTELAAPITGQWTRAGLMKADGDWLDLTVAGHFWQVTMAHLLIKYFNQILQEGLTAWIQERN